MLRLLMISSAIALTAAASAVAQQSPYGTATEAKTMLEKAVSAIRADKAKAIETFNKREAGFKDRDLQPFCFNISDGKLVVATVPSALGANVRSLKDKTGKVVGEELYEAAQEGKVNEVTYVLPRPGETEPAQKTSFITRVDGLGCGVGYFK